MIWGSLIVAGFAAGLIYGSINGALPVRGLPPAARKTNPAYFWTIAMLYTALVALVVWVCSAGFQPK
jgi:hypothetical protein